MNSELYNLIIGKKDKQYTINYLIKKNIINIEEVTSEVIKTNDPKIILQIWQTQWPTHFSAIFACFIGFYVAI